MVTGIVCVMTLISGYTVYRRHPGLRPGPVLWGVLRFLAMMAALVLLLVGVVNLTIQRSPAVAGIGLALTTVVMVLVMCLGIMAMSTPKTATLPEGVVAMTSNRRKLVPWARRLGWALLPCVLLGFAPGGWGTTGQITVGVLLCIALMGFPIAYYTQRKLDYALTATNADPWIAWRYTPAAWQAWTEAEVARVRALPNPPPPDRSLRFLLWGAPIWFAVFAIGSASWKVGLAFSAGLSILIAMLISMKRRQPHADPELRRKQLLKVSPVVLFGDQGLLSEGALLPWVSTNEYLTMATLDETLVEHLYLQFIRILPAGRSGVSEVLIEQRVPVPPGSGPQLAWLQQKLGELCPRAALRLC